jgi:hypothetical protein
LKLGPDFRVTRSASLHAELDALLGQAVLSDGEPASVPRHAGEPAATAV